MRISGARKQPVWAAVVIVGMFVVAIALDLGGWSRSSPRIAEPVPIRFGAPTVHTAPPGGSVVSPTIPSPAAAADGYGVAAGISRREVVVSAGVAQVAEDVLSRYSDGSWTLVLSDHLGLGGDRWGAIFRADDESEVVLALARPTAREAATTTVTEVRIDVGEYASRLRGGGALP